MLPKPEKVKKTKSVEQLGLEETISAVDRLKHKRRWLFLTLIATIGLSFLFWSYRAIRNLIVNPPVFPTSISLSSSTPSLSSQIDSRIGSLLSSVSGWSVSLSSNGQLVNWSQNLVNINESNSDSIISKLMESKDKPKSNISEKLPQGATLIESSQSPSDSTVYQLLVLVPDHQILFVITSPQNFETSYPLISNLVSDLYWLAIRF